MKIKTDQYPVIIISVLVLFTILGLVLGFRPGHSNSQEHGLLTTRVEFTSTYFGNI